MKERKQWQYAMYKNDELLAIGTPKEICEEMNIKIQTFHFYRTNHYKNIVDNSKYKNRRVIIRIKDDEDE